MKYKKIRGLQGQWKAEVTWEDGSKELLTCVHQKLCKGGGASFRYEDPNGWIDVNNKRRDKQFAEQVGMLQSKQRVVVTVDKVNEGKPYGDGYFTREDYLGVFDIADLRFDDNGRLAFRFTKDYRQR